MPSVDQDADLREDMYPLKSKLQSWCYKCVLYHFQIWEQTGLINTDFAADRTHVLQVGSEDTAYDVKAQIASLQGQCQLDVECRLLDKHFFILSSIIAL